MLKEGIQNMKKLVLRVVESEVEEVDASQLLSSKLIEGLLKGLDVRHVGDFAERAIYLPSYTSDKGKVLSLTYKLGEDDGGVPILVPIILESE